MRWKNVLFVVVALAAINLPAVRSAYDHHRLAGAGERVSAPLLQQRTAGGSRFVTFAVPAGRPERGDPAFRGTAQVDAATYAEVTGSRAVAVRVLPGSTTVWRVEGQVTSRAGIVLTLAADLLLVALALGYARFGHRLRAELVLLAEDDPTVAPPDDPHGEGVLERLAGQRYLVRGRVRESGPDAVVLDVGGRRVRVLLDGHPRPGEESVVTVVGTMIA